MKFAIVKKGNHQYFLEEGQILEIPRIVAPEGKDYEFTEVLAAGDDKDFVLGTPVIEGAKVVVFVIKHKKGKKQGGFKYRAKSRYRRRWGYRTLYTRIRVKKVEVPGLQESAQTAENKAKKAPKSKSTTSASKKQTKEEKAAKA